MLCMYTIYGMYFIMYVCTIYIHPSTCLPLHQPHLTQTASYDLSKHTIHMYCMCDTHMYYVWHAYIYYVYTIYIYILYIYASMYIYTMYIHMCLVCILCMYTRYTVYMYSIYFCLSVRLSLHPSKCHLSVHTSVYVCVLSMYTMYLHYVFIPCIRTKQVYYYV